MNQTADKCYWNYSKKHTYELIFCNQQDTVTFEFPQTGYENEV